jgi:exopolysaccharide biosynthesis protein
MSEGYVIFYSFMLYNIMLLAILSLEYITYNDKKNNKNDKVLM